MRKLYRVQMNSKGAPDFSTAEEVETVPERKKGEWMPEFDGNFKAGAHWFSCSKCKRIVPEVRNGGWNFCPNCGARMEGAEDEQTC